MDSDPTNLLPANLTDVASYRQALTRVLAAAGVLSPEVDGDLLLEAALGIDRTTLLLQPDLPVDPEPRASLVEMLRRRVAREPLQLILGKAHFYGLELAVTPGVLIPRPETERLVEIAVHELKRHELELHELNRSPASGAPPVVLDVGCGSGAIALAVKAELPAATVWGADVSPAAVALSARNADALGLDVKFVHSDLLSDPQVAQLAARASAVLSNPPYLPGSDAVNLQPEVTADPSGALFAGEDGLTVARRLVGQAYGLLPPGALLALELDPRNVHELKRTLTGWQDARVEADLTGRERFLVARR